MRRDSIVLVGMSGVGKSEWEKRLKAYGMKTVCCDAEIEKLLGPRLRSLGYRGIEDVSKWMGQPFEKRYKRNSAIYLKYERQVMWSIIRRILSGEKLVVDTTGSVIYMSRFLLWVLRQISTVVLLDASESAVLELCERYFADPKPVVWGDGAWKPYFNEDNIVALKRCFPNLLATRNPRYHKLAHVVLGYHQIRMPGFDAPKLLRLLELTMK